MRRILYSLVLVMLCSMVGYADDLATGEYATQNNGSPAMVGQTTLDHIFVRGDYSDNGTMQTYDNVVSFKSGDIQPVWLWLDDDEIYLNERVQALPPTLIVSGGEPYNEITYYSFQCLVYLPIGINMVWVENEDGDQYYYQPGDRMPNSATFQYYEKLGVTKVVDGITYHVYSLLITNRQYYGTHFSSRNAWSYLENGALKKDDAPLLCIYLQNENQSASEGRLSDMIIANQEFGFIEAFTVDPQWEPNDYRFIYGEGGNNVTPRFQYYNRVALYGSQGMETAGMLGDVNGDGEVDISDVVVLIDVVLGKDVEYALGAADVNGDGKVDISDVVALIDVVLGKDEAGATVM